MREHFTNAVREHIRRRRLHELFSIKKKVQFLIEKISKEGVEDD
jgi:hypothetical protein